jgi:hypothetical protein
VIVMVAECWTLGGVFPSCPALEGASRHDSPGARPGSAHSRQTSTPASAPRPPSTCVFPLVGKSSTSCRFLTKGPRRKPGRRSAVGGQLLNTLTAPQRPTTGDPNSRR